MATNFQDAPRVAMQVTRGIIVASIQVDLTTQVLARFQHELSSLIHQIGAHGVVFDLSGVDILDSVEYAGLRKIMNIAALLGARPVISGLKAGVVASLVIVNADIDDVEATLKTDGAITLIRDYQKKYAEIETDPDENDLQDGEPIEAQEEDLAIEADEPRDPHPDT